MNIYQVQDKPMALHDQFENALMGCVDAVFNRWPQPLPPAERIEQCKIIAHRGEHRSGEEKENTLAAFEKAARAGVWGIELDVQWTKDLIPVVAHDADTYRLYGQPYEISQSDYNRLKTGVPDIPALKEVVTRFGKKLHLMIEIKQQKWIDPPRQARILSETLGALRPGTDYHLLALNPHILMPLTQTPPRAKVPIATYLPDRFSDWVARNQWGGLCGHYLMMRNAIVARHQNRGRHVGTGFANSPNALLRELNRGIDWIFSDNAAQLQTFLKTCHK